MKLFFLRHGLAGHRTQWQGDDAERPLTPEGRQQLQAAIPALTRLQVHPDVILTSPYARAFETAEVVAHGLRLIDRLVREPRLAPGFGPHQLARILEDQSEESSVMLVGHEPDFSETVGELIGGARVVCKKGGLAYVELKNVKKLKGRLVWLLPPDTLAL
jgi:phosphohistidine phosphatase